VVAAPHIAPGLLLRFLALDFPVLLCRSDSEVGTYPIPFLNVDFSNFGMTQRVPAMRVESSNTIRTDREVLPGEFCGCCT
jgi:hypothetical protein